LIIPRRFTIALIESSRCRSRRGPLCRRAFELKRRPEGIIIPSRASDRDCSDLRGQRGEGKKSRIRAAVALLRESLQRTNDCGAVVVYRGLSPITTRENEQERERERERNNAGRSVTFYDLRTDAFYALRDSAGVKQRAAINPLFITGGFKIYQPPRCVPSASLSVVLSLARSRWHDAWKPRRIGDRDWLQD